MPKGVKMKLYRQVKWCSLEEKEVMKIETLNFLKISYSSKNYVVMGSPMLSTGSEKMKMKK